MQRVFAAIAALVARRTKRQISAIFVAELTEDMTRENRRAREIAPPQLAVDLHSRV